MHIPAKVDSGIRALLALAAAGTPQTAEYLAGEQGPDAVVDLGRDVHGESLPCAIPVGTFRLVEPAPAGFGPGAVPTAGR